MNEWFATRYGWQRDCLAFRALSNGGLGSEMPWRLTRFSKKRSYHLSDVAQWGPTYLVTPKSKLSGLYVGSRVDVGIAWGFFKAW